MLQISKIQGVPLPTQMAKGGYVAKPPLESKISFFENPPPRKEYIEITPPPPSNPARSARLRQLIDLFNHNQ